MNAAAAALVEKLGLEPLPHEGGFFARTWTSDTRTATGRPCGTAIYFLLTPDDFSALHRVDADELWHFHGGDPVEHAQLPASFATPGATSPLRVMTIGLDVMAGQLPQLVVPAGVWQGARLREPAVHGWALLSCTMSPGWDERGFALGRRAELTAQFPAARAVIARFTRE